MTKQLIITEEKLDLFNRKCSLLLIENWKIIPGTVVCSADSRSFIAFFEKEELETFKTTHEKMLKEPFIGKNWDKIEYAA